jgi:hypothetical protein
MAIGMGLMGAGLRREDGGASSVNKQRRPVYCIRCHDDNVLSLPDCRLLASFIAVMSPHIMVLSDHAERPNDA